MFGVRKFVSHFTEQYNIVIYRYLTSYGLRISTVEITDLHKFNLQINVAATAIDFSILMNPVIYNSTDVCE